MVQLPILALSGTPQDLRGSLKAVVTGRGLPSITLDVPDFARAQDGWRGQASLAARFDFAMLRGAALAAAGRFAGTGASWTLDLSSCANLKLAAFRSGVS